MQIDYTAFEAHFRGSREEIKAKLSIYLPLIEQLAPTDEHSVLDVGCGRGEWLELLREREIYGEGVDSNHDFIDSCRKNGLTVIQEDVFDFFNRSDNRQYKLITGFHILEHIPSDRQIDFLQHIFSLLAPGGLVILETPNPENITVGSCNFYIDPTHLRPVPPQLASFFALQAGFVSPLIARVNRFTVGNKPRTMPDTIAGADFFNELVNLVSSRLLQAPDYSLIAFKPPAPTGEMLDAVALINEINDSCMPPQHSREYLLVQLHEQDMQLQQKDQELQQVYLQLQQRELELKSIYKTTAGQLIRRYKSWKKKLKSKKKARQKKNKASDLDEYPESVREIYKKLSDPH